jgi:hypothetical protein
LQCNVGQVGFVKIIVSIRREQLGVAEEPDYDAFAAAVETP